MRKFLVGAGSCSPSSRLPAQQMVTETFDPACSRRTPTSPSVKEWTGQIYGGGHASRGSFHQQFRWSITCRW